MTKSSKKVLIVEDDKDFLWLLRQGFDNQDFSVLYALDGEEGVHLAEKEKPDLIIMDILLPKLDGIAATKKIREKGIASQIIFLTNFKDALHITEALEAAGQTDYMVKSDVRLDAILARVKEKLGLVS